MAAVRRMERVEAGVMEPLIDGSFQEDTVQKFAWMCYGCGLVWDRKWHAETCESRRHVSRWQQHYVTGPIVNGKPFAERYYPRAAIRREDLKSVAISDAEELATADAADELLEEYTRTRAQYQANAVRWAQLKERS